MSTKKVLLSIGLSLVLFLILGIHLSKPVYADPTNASYCPSDWVEANVTLGIPNYCCEPGSSYYSDGNDDACKKGGSNGWGHATTIGATVIGGKFCPDYSLITCPGVVNSAKCWQEEDLVDVGCPGSSPADGKYFLGCVPSGTGALRSPVAKELERYLGSGRYEQEVRPFNFCYDADSGSAVYSDSLEVCVCNGETGGRILSAGVTCRDACGTLGIFYNGVDQSGGPGPGNFKVLGCEDPKTNQDDPECAACIAGGNVWTSVGCIDTSQNGIILWVIRFAIGLIIAIAIVRFIQASLMLQKADPESVQEGREMITSAVIALVLALISIPLLSFVGVKVLNIFPEGFL